MEFQLRSRQSIAILAVAVAMVVALGALAGGVTGQASGTTQAPDLQSVDGFEYDAATNTTNVTFSFDEEVDLTSSGGNFRLVPTDGSTDVGGQNVGGNGTANLSVEYSGQLTESDIARGVVKKNTVKVAGEGDETNNPTQAADVSNDGNSADPDLVNVTVNESTNSLIYAFDEPVSVESDGGFEAYAENATTMGSSVATDSLATPKLVSVTFDQYDVSEVVGASVTEGTVSNTSDSDRTNSLDGVTVSNESPPAFSKCGGSGTDDTGDAGNASGPTAAPDLVQIDNVTYRQNPEDTNCQTLVEFDFDEPVNTQGGAGNFQLVPIDGGQTYDGNNEIVGERTNTTSLTVPFDGRIDPSTIARGFVDANTVRTQGENDTTLNPKQAADLNNDGNTENPDLVSITRSSAPDGALLYEFDEEVGEVGDTSGFNFYDGTGTETDAQEVATTDDPSVLSVSFEEGANVSTAAVGGSVDGNAVVGTDTAREDGDVNQPDEVELTGNESIQCGNGTTVANGSGPTAAPDLEAIDGFCTGNLASINGQQTFVNFTFDQPVDIVGGAGNFQLVPVDSTTIGNQLYDGQGEVVAGNGTKTVTVAFAENVTRSDVARGFVDAGTVAAVGEQNPPTNPKQAADVSNDGNTANPDLVSVSPGGTDQLRFEFDEEITEPGDTSGFNFYDANGTEVDAQNLNRTNDSSVISVYFEPQANVSENAVGGSVDANAVVGTETTREDGDVNQPDEVELDGSSGPAPVGNATEPPTDPDGDGKYEDVNGDGSVTQADAQALYDNLDSLKGNTAFDFNGDGSVTLADTQALYSESVGN
ncbi:dockerin type I domain-containing protein [Halococcus salsus]|uniref:dockerin type I domain-containing protein n=1 Tax=Halococcus salsus TaxID=2162894 RepID=UPI00135B0A54|nr:dockerin type I domain-containing protein [Halococcus salsus]